MRQSKLTDFFVTKKVSHGPPYSIIKHLGLDVTQFAGLADLPNELLLSIVSDHLSWGEDSPRATRQLSAVSRRLHAFFGPIASQNLIAIGSKRTHEINRSLENNEMDGSDFRHLRIRVRLVNQVTFSIGKNEVAPMIKGLGGLTSVSLTNVFVCRAVIRALSLLPHLVRLEYDVNYSETEEGDYEARIKAPRHLQWLSVQFRAFSPYEHPFFILYSIIKASSKQIAHIFVDFNIFDVLGMDKILALEIPRLVTCHFYNAYFDLPPSRHVECLDSSNVQEFSILHFVGAEGTDRESRCIPGFDLTLLSNLGLAGTAKELVMTESSLKDPDWEVLFVFFRLHPQLRVVNAWGLLIEELHEVGSQIRNLVRHCKSHMQSVEAIRFSCEIPEPDPSAFTPILCTDGEDVGMSPCPCDGCTNFPDMDYDQRRDALEGLIGEELESHISRLLTSFPRLKLIEWWFHDPKLRRSYPPTIFWEWKITSTYDERTFERRLQNWHSKTSLLP
ncbi:SubName: Full=Uncharacterized protein {ECO:0000313/EMBL:CCA71229.1} [Serendipita indica DSM 11827]|nr:SubName: Full=Uncharacterized protein {ECO:0000313/EMBL:CCA71229.1} [Serendipita indica DSM 11827]